MGPDESVGAGQPARRPMYQRQGGDAGALADFTQPVAEVHDRMPVVLDDKGAEEWINPKEPKPLSLKGLLVPARGELLRYGEYRPWSTVSKTMDRSYDCGRRNELRETIAKRPSPV